MRSIYQFYLNISLYLYLFLLLQFFFLFLFLLLLLFLLFLLFTFSSLFLYSSQSIQECSLNKFERRTIELEEIIAENRRKEILKEGSLSTTKNLLQKAEQRLFQMDSTQSRNSDLESAIITLKGIQGDGCITSHRITSYHIVSHHITSYHIVSHHITSYHITSPHVASHHTTPHRTIFPI